MKPETLALSRTPVLRGEFYCSPACCGDRPFCTKAAYDRANHEAAAMATELGNGWKPDVWENLGWYGSARRNRLRVMKHVGIYSVTSESLHTGQGTTAQAAVCNLRHNIEREIGRLEQLLEDCGDGC